MIQAAVVIGIGDAERNFGIFEFVALPRQGENLLIRLDGELVPLRVVEVCHYPGPNGAQPEPFVALRTEER